MRQLALALVIVVGTASNGAWASESQRSDKATAEALFAEGRKLMTEGRHAEACPKFEASQRIDPGIGTMLNLAECYERIGRTASAWAEFREVVSAARAAESQEREALARQRAQALEGKLSRLTIRVSSDNEHLAGFEVRRGGALVDPAEFGSAIPVDPGRHLIEATAPGKQKWVSTLEVDGNGAQVEIEIPALGGAASASASLGSSDVAGDAATSGRSNRTLALALGAAGLVSVGVGSYFGLRAASTWSDAKKECGAYPYECGARGESLEEDARGYATISTVGFAAGVIGLGAGAVLWLASDSSSAAQTGLAVGAGNVIWRGKF